MIDTKQKILDVAERLFGEQGCAATSLRHIIAEAGVNLAAIHYHFGSKEELIDQLVMRKIVPVNGERLAMLDRLEAEAGRQPVPVEKILDALLGPALAMAGRNPEFPRFMGRLYAEGLMAGIAKKHFMPIFARFTAALRRTLPDLPEDELLWRIHFLTGAMAHTLCGPPEMRPQNGCESPPLVAKRLVVFLSGGFKAPVSQAEPVEVR